MMSSFDQNHPDHTSTSCNERTFEQLNSQDSNVGPSTFGEESTRNKRIRREHDITLALSSISSTIARTETHASPAHENAYPDDAEDLGDGHSSEYERRRLEERREYNRRNAARARLRTKEQISSLIKQVEDLKSKVETMEHQKLEMEIQLTDLRKENKRLYELLHQQRENNLHQNETPGSTAANDGLGTKPRNTATHGTSLLVPSPSGGVDLPSVIPLLHSGMGGATTTGMNSLHSFSAGAMTQQTVLPGPSSSEAQMQQPLINNNMAATLALLLQHNPTIAQGWLTPTPETTQQSTPLSMPPPHTMTTDFTNASAASTAILAALLAINQQNATGHGNNGSLQN